VKGKPPTLQRGFKIALGKTGGGFSISWSTGGGKGPEGGVWTWTPANLPSPGKDKSGGRALKQINATGCWAKKKSCSGHRGRPKKKKK